MAYEKTHIAVVDLETLAKFDDAVILSLGMVVAPYDHFGTEFPDLLKCPSLKIKFNVKEQIQKYGRVTSKSTIDFWQKQNEDARAVLKPSDEDVSIDQLPALLQGFITENGLDWRNIDFFDRNAFDIKKMSHIFEINLGMKTPWDYQACWEIATALKFLGFDRYAGIHPSKVPGMIYHNAHHDAVLDLHRMMYALKSVGVL